MVTRRRQTRISARQSLRQQQEPQFAAPPVLQPKVQQTTEQKLPEWKPGGSRKSSPLQRLRNSRPVQKRFAFSPIAQQPGMTMQQKGVEKRDNLLMKPMAPVQQDAMDQDNQLQTRPLVRQDTSNSSETVQRKIIGYDGEDIWTNEIAGRLAEEKHEDTKRDIQILHDSYWPIQVGSYGGLAEDIDEGEYEWLLERERATDATSAPGEAPILKFNFAGSGQEQWGTHAEWAQKAVGKTVELNPAEHASGGLKYQNIKRSGKKNRPQRDKVVFEYAGPKTWLTGETLDVGGNNTTANLEDAKTEFNNYMAWVVARRPNEIVQINIKGFSRGGATASVFASWIKTTEYKDNVAVNAVIIDPVPGRGPSGEQLLYGDMPMEQDMSNVYEEDKDARKEEQGLKTGTTVVMTVKSNTPSILGQAFTPQKILGAQRVIIAYGKNAQHYFGIGETASRRVKYDGVLALKGMKLSTIPEGLYVVNVDDMNLQRVTTYEDWLARKPEVLEQADTMESRDRIIDETIRELFQRDDSSQDETETPPDPAQIGDDYFGSDSED